LIRADDSKSGLEESKLKGKNRPKTALSFEAQVEDVQYWTVFGKRSV
jgi:hypothetical protein